MCRWMRAWALSLFTTSIPCRNRSIRYFFFVWFDNHVRIFMCFAYIFFMVFCLIFNVLRFSCPWLCNKIFWMFSSYCIYFPNFMNFDFFCCCGIVNKCSFYSPIDHLSCSVLILWTRMLRQRNHIVVMIRLTPQTVWSCGAITCCFLF